MIPYGHQSINAADLKAVRKVLLSEWLTQGPEVSNFEKALTDYTGARYAVVFANGTAALHAAYYVTGLKPGDEFITTPLTFAATANAGLYLGAKPVFADINHQGNLDPVAVAQKITAKTKMIAVVDYAGLPVDLRAFKTLAKKHNLILIEDACHALGAEYQGKKIGSISDMSIFSFHPVKSITTGEGGAVLTNNKKYYDQLIMFRTHGLTKDPTCLTKKSPGDWYHEMQMLGFNYRLTDLQAALGTSQMRRLDRFIAAREKIAARYDKELSGLADHIILPPRSTQKRSSWHLYCIRLTTALANKRSTIFQELRAAGIGVQVHYIPVYFHPYYQGLGYAKGLCPKAESWYESAISLPIFPELTKHQQDIVITTVRKILDQAV